MEERLQKLGQAIAKALWLKHRSAGRSVSSYVSPSSRSTSLNRTSSLVAWLRAAIASLERLRADNPPAICFH